MEMMPSNILVKPSLEMMFGLAEAMIMSGVTICHGAIIASRAVMTKDMARYEIVGGHPAKHIKFRFSDSDITKLLEISWWDCPDTTLRAAMKQLCSSKIDKLYNYWQLEVRK